MIDSVETTKRICKSCGSILDEKLKDPCPYCGSHDTTIEVEYTEPILFTENVEITLIQRIRKTPIYLMLWFLMLISAISGLFIPTIYSTCLAVILGIFGIYMSPYAERIVEHHERT